MLLGINIKFVLLDIILAGFIKLLRTFKRGDNSLKTQASFNFYWSNQCSYSTLKENSMLKLVIRFSAKPQFSLLNINYGDKSYTIHFYKVPLGWQKSKSNILPTCRSNLVINYNQ